MTIPPSLINSTPSQTYKVEGITGLILIHSEIDDLPYLQNKLSEWDFGDIITLLATFFGTILRLWCYKVLDMFFTFNVEIKKNHKLITTGPYRFLIHPSG
ncbi:16595_t:CDS:2 [Dentiscutata erythropus]|uniref:Protein-S-isoprenylcysteine O-methyltransferase n=1 Tax=Dentiscutata erythropus TaxID=1348616 RepID=A0A9N9G798_9GLOM|nr:16595_t:CDS:2 [Dentiscutata erythropus]